MVNHRSGSGDCAFSGVSNWNMRFLTLPDNLRIQFSDVVAL